ncbi:MAG: c-type cytochrome, partial [Longimicrobiales bacterium]
IDPYESPRPAPPGAVPYASPAGDVPPPIVPTVAGLEAFGATARNPLAMSDTTALRVGQVMYDRHCAVCHGAQGKGDGPVVGPGKFPPLVPNVTLPITVGRTDAYIYAVMSAGRSLMPSYGPRMSNHELWATVNYVRQLQRQAGAAPVLPTAPDTTRGPGR